MADHLDPRALRAFCSIADHGSLTRAAAALGVAQSALSRRVAALESALGGRLFHRTGRGTLPTELGQRLLARARAILAEGDALIEEARGERASPAGTVELALVPAAARPLVSALALRLRKDYPRIRLRAVEAYSGQVEDWLASGRADIGLFNRYGSGTVRGAELYLRADIVLVAPRGRLAPRGGEIAFRALEGLPLVLPPRPNSLVAAIADIALRHRVRLNMALEAGSPTLIHDAVKTAGFCTLVPQHLAEREYAGSGFAIALVVKPSLHQKTWLAYTTQRPASVAARVVGRLICEMAPAR